MWAKIWKSREEEGDSCLPHQSKAATAAAAVDVERFGEEEEDLKGHTDKTDSSFLHSVINMVGMLIGLGQLSTPYALETGGWASAFLLILLGAACAYTACLLGHCMRSSPKSRDYKDIGGHAFGAGGRVTATAFIYMEIFMALVSYTISLHDNLATVFSGLDLSPPHWARGLSTPQMLAVIAVLVALPTLWLRDLTLISFLSVAGIALSALIFGSVACTAVFGGVGGGRNIPALRLGKIPAISGLYMFSLAGHIVFPNIYTAMKDPSKFTKVSIVSFSMVTLLYTSLAFMGAKMFGPQVSPQITLSLPPNHTPTKIALWATVLTPMTKYALEFTPFAIQLEQRLPHSMNSRTKTVVRGAVGSVLLLLILVLALSVPYFEHVLSLTGSLVSVGICIVLPCVFYTKIFWRQISRPVLVLNVILVTFGVVIGASGTFSSSKALLRSLQRPRHAT